MGCHTWFCKPVTIKEQVEMMHNAPKYITEIKKYDEYIAGLLMKSYEQNIPCVYGKYWWEFGCGYNDDDVIRILKIEKHLYAAIQECFDLFVIKTYSKKIIHSRYELRKYLRKRYFDLTEEQKNKISEFFEKYPGGVIMFE